MAAIATCSQQQLDKLQRVLNCAARVIYGGRRSDHVTPLLRDSLHWLRIRERITFKLCLLVYKARSYSYHIILNLHTTLENMQTTYISNKSKCV